MKIKDTAEIENLIKNNYLKVNEKNVLLIHGEAGSGKSTIAKKLELLIWEYYDKQLNRNE